MGWDRMCLQYFSKASSDRLAKLALEHRYGTLLFITSVLGEEKGVSNGEKKGKAKET